MNARTIKSRLRHAEARTEVWRKRMLIDPNWVITVLYQPEKDPNSPDDQILFDDSSAEYWKITLTLMPALMDQPVKEFKNDLETALRHEMLHIIMWQLTSFCLNMAGKKCETELIKLEEQCVQKIEDMLARVRW